MTLIFLQSTEFDIDKEYVGRIVGAQGAGVNKLRDQLGVKVDVTDDHDDRETVVGKKKKVVHTKSKVKVENVSFIWPLVDAYAIARLLGVRRMSRMLRNEF